jgi:hypothetical protein
MGSALDGLLPKSVFSDYHEGYDVFSEMPGGRPSSFQGVTEWGTRHHPSVTPLNDQAGSLGIEEKTS